MKYNFPVIQHLDDVRPAIEGRDEFIIAERDWGYVVNYMVAMSDTFPAVNTVHLANGDEQMRGEYGAPIFETNNDYHAAIRRECRGLLFNKDGTVMARRLHKFFNINERDETQFERINFDQPHVILEKLDGSMITPVPTEAGLRWGTKMGITDVAMGAELFVAHNPHYATFAQALLDQGYCAIFEWCSRKQRIVVDYPEDRLVLIAIRENRTGEYVPYDRMVMSATAENIDVVKAYNGTATNMKHLMAETKDAEGIEGWIIRFEDGHMLKVKGEWYLRIHKTKDNLTHEKNVVDLLVNEKMDDAKAFMMAEDRERVEAFETLFWEGVASMVDKYDKYWLAVQGSGLDRKGYAQNWMPTIKAQDPLAPSIIFGKFDGKDTRTMVVDAIRKNTGTQTKIDAARYLWEGARWNYHFAGDE